MTPILADIPWAVVGAVATRLYMPERMTRDLDVVIAAADAERAAAVLRAAGWRQQEQRHSGGASWLTPSGDEVDVIEGAEPWWPAALREAQDNRDEQGLPVLPLPYLVLMKFRASRTVDIGDIVRMLGGAGEGALEATRRLFGRFEPAGREDLESLIELGRLEQSDG